MAASLQTFFTQTTLGYRLRPVIQTAVMFSCALVAVLYVVVLLVVGSCFCRRVVYVSLLLLLQCDSAVDLNADSSRFVSGNDRSVMGLS